MSNYLAIATVTATLGDLVHRAAEGAIGRSVSLHFGRPGPSGSLTERRVHVYLYHITPNAALRNTELPWRNAEGRPVRRAQAALDLHYLLSFYGEERTLEPDRMVGAVARDLTARAILAPPAIADAIASRTELTGSDLAEAKETVKFVPAQLSLDEFSKLWSIMVQTPHALSIAYQGTVVLIDEDREVGRPAPILRRGEEDQGADVRASALPQLEGWWAGTQDAWARAPRPPSVPMAQLGLRLVLHGRNLGDAATVVRLAHRDLPIVHDIMPAAVASDSLTIDLPNDASAQAAWAAGFYNVTAHRGMLPPSGPLPLPLAPLIDDIMPNPAARDASGNVTLTVACRPQVHPRQKASLLLPGLQTAAAPIVASSASLVFNISAAPALDAVPVLRVGEVESMTFHYDADENGFAFADSQKVTIT